MVVNRDDAITRWNQKFLNLWKIPQELIYAADKNPVLDYVANQMLHTQEFHSLAKETFEHAEETRFDNLYLADGRIFELYSQPQKLGTSLVGRVWDMNGMLERMMDERNLAKTVIEDFPGDMPLQMPKLEEYVTSGDTDTIERQAKLLEALKKCS